MSKTLGVGSWILGSHIADSESFIGIIVKHHPEVTDGWLVKMEIWGDYLDPRARTELQNIKAWTDPTSSWQTTLRLFGGNPSAKDRELQKKYIEWLFSKEAIW